METLKQTQIPNVLVVDDASIIRTVCERALAHAGYQVKIADSGETALKIMEEHPADVMLLDIRMPGISGVEVLRTVRKNWPLTEVVIMTAYADQDIAEETLRLGAREILLKPFPDIKNMVSAVTKALTRSQIQKKGLSLDDQTIKNILIDQGILSQENLERAIKLSQEKNISLVQALLSLNLISKEDIDWAMARFLEISYIQLQENLIDQNLIKEFPEDLARKFSCLPLWKDDQAVHLIMANPFDFDAIETIEQTLDQKIIPAKGNEEEIKRIIEKFYSKDYQQLPLEKLVQLLEHSKEKEKVKILEVILRKNSIKKLQKAELIPINDDSYQINISAIISAGGKLNHAGN